MESQPLAFPVKVQVEERLRGLCFPRFLPQTSPQREGPPVVVQAIGRPSWRLGAEERVVADCSLRAATRPNERRHYCPCSAAKGMGPWGRIHPRVRIPWAVEAAGSFELEEVGRTECAVTRCREGEIRESSGRKRRSAMLGAMNHFQTYCIGSWRGSGSRAEWRWEEVPH